MNVIQYIEHKDIDKGKWDRCIQNSYNGLVYSSSTYLYHMAGKWDAVILNDYEAVLPLPWRKKWGIYYVYPPAFTQQMGITGNHKITEELFALFIDVIPKKFRYIEINLNSTHHINNPSLFARKNYLLNLADDYIILKKSYSRSASRNINNAAANGISIIENVTCADIVQLHRQRFKDEIGFHQQDYDNFLSLLNELVRIGACYCIGAVNTGAVLIAGSIYIIYKNRLYFVINGNTDESLKVGATHMLMDYTIQKFSGQNFTLDFEGSDHPSFARFYDQYGATPETYYFFSLNRLPWPVSLFKTGINSPVSKR
ncbi:MAG: hypothetical protein H7Y86_01285 [Rhizobacter sp.]|nr:hypothetical protein [Ferruginibacter sp.]